MLPYLVAAAFLSLILVLIVVLIWAFSGFGARVIDFSIHEDAREDWLRLCARMGVMGVLQWLQRLQAHIRAHQGITPEAVPDPRCVPTIYWLILEDVGVQYILQDRGKRSRRVIFIGFDLYGPPLTAPATPG